MKILLLGSTGFVGKYLHSDLIKNHDVITASRSAGNIQIDLCNYDTLNEVFSGEYFDVVISSAVTYSPELTKALDNARITSNIISYFKDKSKLIIFISSVSADETNKYKNAYNMGKYLELETIRYYRQHWHNICVLKFCQIIDHNGGSRNSQPGFHYIVDSINSGQEVKIFGKNDTPRSYISVNMVCDIVKYTIDHQITGEHNIVLGPRYTLNELARLLIMQAGKNQDILLLDKEGMHYSIPANSKRFDQIIQNFDIKSYLSSFVK